MLVFRAIIRLIPAIQDLDQASDEMMFVTAHNTFIPLFYISNRLRVCFMPTFMIGASASLILCNNFTWQKFLLSGSTISFVFNIDDLAVILFVGARRGGSEWKWLWLRCWSMGREKRDGRGTASTVQS